jgi:hypothetical protein
MWRKDEERALCRRACPYALIAFEAAITKGTISICFVVALMVRAIAATSA